MNLRPLIACVVLPLLLSSCASVAVGADGPQLRGASKHDQGPLELGSPAAESCLEAGRGDSQFSYGFENVRNTGYAPTEITEISLIDARGLQIVESVLVPLEDSAVVGNFAAWPPPAHRLGNGIDWDNRADADNFAVPTTPASEQGYNLILHLQRTGGRATFDGIKLTYDVPPQTYTRVSRTAFKVKRSC